MLTRLDFYSGFLNHWIADLGIVFAGKPVTAKELDERCEAYLKEHFGEAVDFALEKSLPVLIEDGLITRDAEASQRSFLHTSTLQVSIAKDVSAS